MLNKYQRLLIALAGCVTIAGMIIVPLLVKVIYVHKYVLTGIFFQILSVRYFLWSCYALLGVALLGLGRMRENFFASGIYVPIAISLSIIFIVAWGPIGAAYAQVGAGACSLIVTYLNYKYTVRVHFDTLWSSLSEEEGL